MDLLKIKKNAIEGISRKFGSFYYQKSFVCLVCWMHLVKTFNIKIIPPYYVPFPKTLIKKCYQELGSED